MRSWDRLIKQWIEESKIKEGVFYDADYRDKTITIYTSWPGYMIGYHGQLVDKYNKRMGLIWPDFKGFRFKEMHNWVDWRE